MSKNDEDKKSKSGKYVISMKQVAKETGFSLPTVSRVLGGHSGASVHTRDHIMDVAKRLGWRPNLLVQGMQTGQTRMIGVMLYIGDEFFGRVAVGVHDELVANDYVPITLWTQPTRFATVRSNEQKQLDRLLDRRVDGIIICPRDDLANDDCFREIWEREIPLITVDRQLPNAQADFVGTDDEMGGRLAAEHLLGLGHRSFGVVTGPKGIQLAQKRVRGFMNEVEAGENTKCLIWEEPTFSDGRAAAKYFLDRENRPTAIFAPNDRLITGIYEVARQKQISIPRDLSIIGFGDLERAFYLKPALTTIRQQPERIGHEAVHLLLDRLQNRLDATEKQSLKLPPELIVRESTAPVNVNNTDS